MYLFAIDISFAKLNKPTSDEFDGTDDGTDQMKLNTQRRNVDA